MDLADGEPGLGAHLHDAIARPVISVAKTRFSGADAVEIWRGESQKPLYITAAGLSAGDAALRICPLILSNTRHFQRPRESAMSDSGLRGSPPPVVGWIRSRPLTAPVFLGYMS